MGILIFRSRANPESFVSGHGFIRAEKQRKNEPALAAALSEVEALGILTFFAASTTPNRVPHFRPLLPEVGILIFRSGRIPRASYQGTDLSVPKKQRKNELALAAALSEVEALGILTFFAASTTPNRVPHFRPLLPEVGILIFRSGRSPESLVSGHGFIRAEKAAEKRTGFSRCPERSRSAGGFDFFYPAITTRNGCPTSGRFRKWGFYRTST